jgi:hypothetical protein
MARDEVWQRRISGYLHVSQEELNFRIELRVCNEENIHKFHCPCRECHKGGRRRAIDVIREHLRLNLRDPHLLLSHVGGDPPAGYPLGGMWVDEVGQEWIYENEQDLEDVGVPGDDSADFSEIFHKANDDFLDPEHDIQQHLFDPFHVGDELLAGSVRWQDNKEGTEDLEANTIDGVEHLYEQAVTPIFGNSSMNVISITIVLMNVAVIHGCSNAYMDELFRYLSRSLLPGDNKLPSGHYTARNMIRKLGLSYEIIHACPFGCILYQNKNADLIECLKINYRKSRYFFGYSNPSMFLHQMELCSFYSIYWECCDPLVHVSVTLVNSSRR